jgi:hypothetical protein
MRKRRELEVGEVFPANLARLRKENARLRDIVNRLPKSTDGLRVCIADKLWIDPEEQGWVDPWESQPHFDEGCGPVQFTVTSYARVAPPKDRDRVDKWPETQWELVQADGDDVDADEYYWWEGPVYSTEEAANAARKAPKS